jgi:hypothetical protein
MDIAPCPFCGSDHVERHYSRHAGGTDPGCLDCEGSAPIGEWTVLVAAVERLRRINLEDLVAQLRENTSNDVEFAQRVALACIALIETKTEPVAAIRVTFRIQ